MASSVPGPIAHDFLTDIINVHWGGKDVYIIIGATNNDYAQSNLASVKVLDQRSEFLAAGDFEPVSGTLIESPDDAGENVIRLNTTSHSPVGVQNIWVFVCPKTDEVKDSWFDYVLAMFGGGAGLVDANGWPKGPYLWIAHTVTGSPTEMNFTIRNESHLLIPPPVGEEYKDVMVQAYPTSGNSTWPFAPGGVTYVITGWNVMVYRLDKEGTGQIYSGGAQAAWATDDVLSFLGSSFAPFKGLKFGIDPPKINSDIPLE
jgi:hypothetical protein